MNAVDKQIKEIRTTAELVIAAQGGDQAAFGLLYERCLLYTSPSPRDLSTSRMPSSA